MTERTDDERLIDGPPGPYRFLRQAGQALVVGDAFYRAVLDALPAAVYTTNPAGLITYYNDAAAALWGQRPELGESAWCGSWKLYRPDGRFLPHDECPMASLLRYGECGRTTEIVAERPDGSRVPFIPYPTLLYDPDGVIVGAVNMLVDVTDRKRGEKNASRLVAIVDSSDDAIISKNLDGIIESWNGGAERLFGYLAAEAIGKPITMLIPPERVDEETEIIRRITSGERVHQFETVRKRKDGSLVDISLTVSPLKSFDGAIIGASKIARDITESKKTQEQLNLLLGEMKHRFRNILSIVQAIASQTLEGTTSEARDAFAARLQALAAAQELLSISNWKKAPLREVIARALAPFQQQHHERICLEGPDGIWLDARKVTMLSMGLHELATNAAKYGALSNAAGRIRVSWSELDAAEPTRIGLCWREEDGPPVKSPARKGFGSTLLERALEAELDKVDLEFRPSGLVCSVELTVDRF